MEKTFFIPLYVSASFAEAVKLLVGMENQSFGDEEAEAAVGESNTSSLSSVFLAAVKRTNFFCQSSLHDSTTKKLW
jgi:hypothetical protein